jgi:hypothetical protein
MSPEERAKSDTELYKKELNLTADQEKEVYDLSLKYSNKFREIFQSSSGDRESMRSEMMKVREERDKDFKKVLDGKQYKGYLRIQEERRRQMREGRRGGNIR